MNMQGMKGVNALSKGMEEIKRKQGSSEKEAKSVGVALNTVVCDEAKLSAQAKLEQVWEGLDSENKIRGRFKKFEITPDGKYEIETKNGSETIADPANKTSASTFKKTGKDYEVGAEWNGGADKLNVTKVAVNGKTVEDGNFSYIDGNTLYVYEGIGSNGDKDYSKAGLNKMDVSYFTSADGNIVRDTEHYNKLLQRSKELENLMKTVPVDDAERAKKKVDLVDSLHGDSQFLNLLNKAYYSCGGWWDGGWNSGTDPEINKFVEENYYNPKKMSKFWSPKSGIKEETWSKYWRDFHSEYDKLRDRYDIIVEENGCSKRIDGNKLKNLTEREFNVLCNTFNSKKYIENLNKLRELYCFLKHDGTDEMKVVKHEYDCMVKEMEAMRSDAGYQEKVKNAVKENLLPGIVVE